LILHKEVESPPIPYLELRIDPGSKFTGFALVDTGSNAVIWAMELEHRGGEISSDLQKRAAQRRDAERLIYDRKHDSTVISLKAGLAPHSYIECKPLRRG